MIRQLIVFRRDDFPGLIPDRNTAKPKSPEGDEELLVKVGERVRDLLGGFKGPLNNLGIPLLDWRGSIPLETPPKPPPPPPAGVFADIPGVGRLGPLRQAGPRPKKKTRPRCFGAGLRQLSPSN